MQHSVAYTSNALIEQQQIAQGVRLDPIAGPKAQANAITYRKLRHRPQPSSTGISTQYWKNELLPATFSKKPPPM
jgi:hypothetical protein